jgi:hypothetical protein
VIGKLFHGRLILSVAALAVIGSIVLLTERAANSSRLAAQATGGGSSASAAGQAPVLAACSGSLNLFNPREFLDWEKTYHGRVGAVIKAHLEDPKVICTKDEPQVPTEALKLLARDLPPWQNPAPLDSLSEKDMGAVLLEYLRIYECSMRQYQITMANEIRNDAFIEGSPTFLKYGLPFSWYDLSVEMTDRDRKIQTEMTAARAALERTLSLVGGMDRLRPLDTNMECLQRSSLDIRNIMSLAADTTACLPRVWDARGSLRDLYP